MTNEVHIDDFQEDDIIIAFMGPTGVGKSFFIDLLTEQPGRRAGNNLKSKTMDIEATRVRHSTYGNRIVLVDTPGFDDTTRTDMEILKMISDWLVKTYNRDVKLSGLIYLHRITDNRMAGSPWKNLRMFGNLCGDLTMSRVILVSTMWDRVDNELGATREKELRDRFWATLIDKGSMVDRLQRSDRREAWRVVEALTERHREREGVLLQEELVDLKKRLNETEAGKVLYSSLQVIMADQKDHLKDLLNQMESSGADPKIKKELEKEYKKLEDQFQRTFEEAGRLKIPLSRRVMMFFSRKKAHGKAIEIPARTGQEAHRI